MEQAHHRHTISIAVILLGLDSYMTSVETFPYICTAWAWILMSGFTLSFGSMFSKTWRVHSIFTNVQLNKKVRRLQIVCASAYRSVLSNWELPSLLSPSFIARGRMEARRAALILMKNSRFNRTPQYWSFFLSFPQNNLNKAQVLKYSTRFFEHPGYNHDKIENDVGCIAFIYFLTKINLIHTFQGL